MVHPSFDRGTPLPTTYYQTTVNYPRADSFSPVCDLKQMSAIAVQGGMATQSPCIVGQVQGGWHSSTPYLYSPVPAWPQAHRAHAARAYATHYMGTRSAPYCLPHPRLRHEQQALPRAHEAQRMAYQAAYPWCFYGRRDGLPMLSPVSPDAGDGIGTAGGAAPGPLFRGPGAVPFAHRPGPRVRPDPCSGQAPTQHTARRLQGLGDAPAELTSLEDAMKLFQCEPEREQQVRPEADAAQRAQAPAEEEAGASPARGSRGGHGRLVQDNSLDNVDMEACVQRCIEDIQTAERSPPATAKYSEMDFFYDVDSIGHLCDFQLFGQSVSVDSDQEDDLAIVYLDDF